MDAEEIHTVVQALSVNLDLVASDFNRHDTLTDGVVDLDAGHALTLDVQHSSRRVGIELQAMFEFVDTFHPSLERGLGAIEGLAVDDGVGLHHVDA